VSSKFMVEHSYSELYHHRAALFVALMRSFQSISWKSRLHHDGSKYAGYFIAGIDLPTGDVTFHMKDIYWDYLILVPTLDKAPPWDGHSSHDAADRLLAWIPTPPLG
jgi:hypothetical protein